MNEITFLRTPLDRLADQVEQMLVIAGIPGKVYLGVVDVERETIQMRVHWRSETFPFDNCMALNRQIASVFGCYGGVDVYTKDVFLQAAKPLYTKERNKQHA